MMLTLADRSPPDVLESAGALAMDTLNLVLANDDIGESSTIGQREDSVGVAALSLTSAADTTAVGLEATVEAARDLLGFREGFGACGGRDSKSGTLVKAKEVLGGLV